MTRPAPPPPPPPGLSALVLMGCSLFAAPHLRVSLPRLRSEDELDFYSTFAICRLPLFSLFVVLPFPSSKIN